MTAEANCLFDAAMKLTAPDRLMLAERLLETVSPECAAPFDPAWEAELQRRAAEMDQSDDAEISWEQLRREK